MTLASIPLLPTANLLGKPTGFPVSLHNKPVTPPSAATFVIDWNSYGVGYMLPTLGVKLLITPTQQQNVAGLDAIRSVKIDNSYCPVPVFLLFPDTGDVITCPPFGIVQSTVLTNAFTAVLYGDGFYDGRPPETTVEFFNGILDAIYIPGTLLDAVDVRYVNSQNIAFAANVVATFAAAPIVIAPSATRLVAVTIAALASAAGAPNLNALTINGVPALIAGQISTTGTGGPATVINLALAYALVPTGNTIQVIGTYSQTMKAAQMTAFSIVNYTNVLPVFDSAQGAGVAADSSLTRFCQFNVIPGAGAVFGAQYSSAGAFSAPWFGADPAIYYFSGGNAYTFTSASAEYSEKAGITAGVPCNALVGALWI